MPGRLSFGTSEPDLIPFPVVSDVIPVSPIVVVFHCRLVLFMREHLLSDILRCQTPDILRQMSMSILKRSRKDFLFRL